MGYFNLDKRWVIKFGYYIKASKHLSFSWIYLYWVTWPIMELLIIIIIILMMCWMCIHYPRREAVNARLCSEDVCTQGFEHTVFLVFIVLSWYPYCMAWIICWYKVSSVLAIHVQLWFLMQWAKLHKPHRIHVLT